MGQLGFNDDIIEKTRPALVIDSATSKVVDVSAGGMHSKTKPCDILMKILIKIVFFSK